MGDFAAMTLRHTLVVVEQNEQTVSDHLMGYNDPAARGILGLMSARVPPKLSSDFDCCAVYSPRTVLVALGRTLNPVCLEQPGHYIPEPGRRLMGQTPSQPNPTIRTDGPPCSMTWNR